MVQLASSQLLKLHSYPVKEGVGESVFMSSQLSVLESDAVMRQNHCKAAGPPPPGCAVLIQPGGEVQLCHHKYEELCTCCVILRLKFVHVDYNLTFMICMWDIYDVNTEV